MVDQAPATVCTPIILEKVCATGTKCFHDIHFLFEDITGFNIPSDACPINCFVSGLQIVGVDIPVPPGGFPPRRVGNCIIFTVRYTVTVFFEFTNVVTGIIEIGTARATFDRELSVPVTDIQGGCVLCTPEATTICVRNINFDCIMATVVTTPTGFPPAFPPFAIQVTVEKQFFALQSGNSIVCLPTCVQPCIELPFPVLPGECIPFEKPAQCPCFCEENDLQPGRCAQCPPPQNCETTTTTTTSSTTSSTSTSFSTTQAGSSSTTSSSTSTSTTSTTSTSSTTTQACQCFTTGGGTGTLASGENVSLGYNACPGCNFNGNVTFSIQINGQEMTLHGPTLLALQCNDEISATITGAGTFGHGSDTENVTFTLVVNAVNNSFSLVIRNLMGTIIFTTNGFVTLTGQGIMIRDCPLGPG